MINKINKLYKKKTFYAGMFLVMLLVISQFFQSNSLKHIDFSDLVVYYDLSDRQFNLPIPNFQDFLNSTIVIFAFSSNTCTECVIFHLKSLNALAQKLQAAEDLIWILNCSLPSNELYKKILRLKFPLISCENLNPTTTWINPEYFPLFIVLKHGKIKFAWRADTDKIDKSLMLIKQFIEKD